MKKTHRQEGRGPVSLMTNSFSREQPCRSFRSKSTLWSCLLGVIMLVAAVPALGQALEPRLYANIPTGLNFLLSGFGVSEGGAMADPSIDLEDGELTFHSLFLASAHSFGLWGKSAKFDVVVPYGFASGSAIFNEVEHERDVDGFADPQFRLSWNFFGAPALSLKEFRDYQQDLVIGTSLQVTVPAGQYDGDEFLNIGTHRWSIKPEIGISKTFGPVITELDAAATLFTANDDFMGGQKKEQEPLYSVQGHIIYVLNRGVWAAIDATYYTGGKVELDGVEQRGFQQNSRIGATLALPVSKANSIKLYASTGVYTRTGTSFNSYGAAWQYRWGKDL